VLQTRRRRKSRYETSGHRNESYRLGGEAKENDVAKIVFQLWKRK
jgi:hypothetical protein